MARFYPFFLSGGVLVLDQAVKRSGFLVEKICNKGVSFGMPLSQEIIFFLVVSLLIVLLREIRLAFFASNKVLVLGWSILFFGALSNLFDRVSYGCVIDYIRVSAYFPWFNIADVGIVCGGCLVMREYWKKKV